MHFPNVLRDGNLYSKSNQIKSNQIKSNIKNGLQQDGFQPPNSQC
jgi:hypothetical protein